MSPARLELAIQSLKGSCLIQFGHRLEYSKDTQIPLQYPLPASSRTYL